MTRILIADDRESMRIALRALIRMRPDWQICGEASDGRDVVAKAAKLQPDLVVLDFKMPLANGIKAGSEIGLVCVASIPYELPSTESQMIDAAALGLSSLLPQPGSAFLLHSERKTEATVCHRHSSLLEIGTISSENEHPFQHCPIR